MLEARVLGDVAIHHYYLCQKKNPSLSALRARKMKMLQMVAALTLCTTRALVGSGVAVRVASTVRPAKKKKSKGAQELKRAELPAGAARPKLIVFDLDNTLWTPELYQLRGKKPKANKDVKLFPGALDALHDLAGDGWAGTQAAVVSRATATDWAEKLLQDFTLEGGRSVATLLPFREIYEGNKRKHLQRIREASGVAYCDMLFFDDYTENLGDAAHLGVMGIHTPRGLTHELWAGGLNAYARLKARDTSFMGRMFTLCDLREAD